MWEISDLVIYKGPKPSFNQIKPYLKNYKISQYKKWNG